MKKVFSLFAPLSVILVCAFSANAQHTSKRDNVGMSTAGMIARGTGKAAIIVVGSAAEAGWAVTKFAAKEVAKPVAKTLFLRAVPKLTVFALKNSSGVAKKLGPTILKVALL